MPSGAGLNRYGTLGGVPILTIPSGASALAAPLAGYGTIGQNDSGGVAHAAAGFTKWTFQLIGPGAGSAGYTVSLYGTVDPALLQYVYTTGPSSGQPMDTCATTAIPASSWFLLPAPSEQSGTGQVGNPLVSSGAQLLIVSMDLIAVRAVLTTIGAPTKSVTVLASAAP